MQAEDKDILKAVGTIISRRRKHRKITQDDLAQGLGCLRETITQMETGRLEIYLDDLQRIATTFKLDPKGLVPDRATIGTESLRSCLPDELSLSEMDLFEKMTEKRPKKRK